MCGAAGGTFICRNRPVEQSGGIHRRSAEEIFAFPIKLTLQKTVLIRENKGVQHEFDLQDYQEWKNFKTNLATIDWTEDIFLCNRSQ